MSAVYLLDLDDTTSCPRSDRCEVCSATTDLTTKTYTTRVGVICLRLCGPDAGQRTSGPPVERWGEALDRVLDHCEHLGITLGQMSDALAEEGVYG